MENKVLKKILVMAIVFVMTFSNCGLTLQALATSEGLSFFGFKLFAKNNLDYEAYFLDENGKKTKEMKADVNQDMTLVLELEPKEVGYLKSGTIKAVTDEGEPNFEFLEVLNFSTQNDEEEESTQQLVQADKPLLQSEQVVNADLQTVSLDGSLPETITSNSSGEFATNEILDNTTNQNAVATNNTVNSNEANTAENTNTVSAGNTVTEENTVTNEIANPETTIPEIPSEEKAPELSVITPPPALEADDTLVDEDNAYKEQVKEKEDAEVQAPSSSSAKIISGNEILVENIIHQSTIYVKIGYKAGEVLKVADLYKNIKLDLAGTYINEDLQEVEVKSTDEVNTEWTYSSDILLASDVSKISAFEIEGTRGTLVEGKVILNRECTEDKYLPIKETTLEIEVPQINGKLPIALDVHATKLKATKGQEINEVTFTEDNWSYNESTKTITIKITNPEAVLTKGEDIYTVVLRYEDYVGSEEITVNLKGKVTVEEYSGKSNNLIVKEFSADKTTLVNIGELITYSIGTTEDTISKGLINANYNSVDAVYEAEFTSTVGINILTNDVLEEFTLKDTKEYYIDKDKIEFETQDVKYKTVKFRYNELMTLLDQGGIIEIRSNTGEVLYTLSKDNANSQETCEIALNGDVRGVEVSFRNIVVNGTFTIDFVKSLGKCTYDKSAFNNFDKIESRIKAEVKYGTSEEVIPLTPIKTEKYFEKSYTRAEISMSKEELSTTVDNDDVELKIELNNNTEKSDLYINPEFEVVFPEHVQNVEVRAVNLLYEDGLTVKNITLFRDETNHQRMKIQLEGVQRNFSTSDGTNGTNIIINTKIQIDDYAPRKDDQLKMYYFNQGVSNYQSQTDWKISSPIPAGILKTTNGFDIEVFSYKAPIGFITTNSMENYDGLGGTIESIKQGEITALVAMGEVPRQVIMNLAAMNNTGNKCTDVAMLGRIPHSEATDVITGEKTKSNRNSQMITGITQADSNPIGCDIYYSPSAIATKDLNDSNNQWTKTPESIETMKSYLIVPTGEVEPGTVFKFYYTFQIPANLPYEVELYGSFGAFYNNHSDVAVMYESSSADLVGLVTEAGPKLEASLSVDIGDGKVVGEARYIKYTVTVANTGSVTAENVRIENVVPDYTTLQAYTEENGYGNDNYVSVDSREVNANCGNIEPGDRKEFRYYVKTGSIPTPEAYYKKTLGVKVEKDEKGYFYREDVIDSGSQLQDSQKKYLDTNYTVFVENKATVKAENFGDTITTNSTKNELVKSNFDMTVNTECKTEIKPGQLFTYKNDFCNISDNDLKNVVVTLALPNTVEYAEDNNEIHSYEGEAKYDLKYDESSHTVTVTFAEMKAEESYSVYIGAKGKTGNAQKIDTFFTVGASGVETEKSYVLTRQYIGPEITINQTTDVINNLKEKAEVKLTLEIENKGNYVAENFVIKDQISENLTDVVVQIDGNQVGKYVGGTTFTYTISNFKAGAKVIMTIIGKAAELNGTSKTISNKAEATANYMETVSSNVININIEEDPNKPVEKPIYKNEETNNSNSSNNNQIRPNENNNSSNNNRNPITNNNSSNSNNGNNDNSSNNANQNNNSSNNSNSNNDNKAPQAPVETHSITGQVWLDVNRNNRKDDEEKGISAIEVELHQGRNVVKTTTTNGSGVYQFTGVTAGDYTINFKYDGEKYIASTYKGVDIEEDRNSDAMNYTDGIAVTNTITITDLNLENINCGLQERNIFDLKVEKFIAKSVVDVKGKTVTKTYDNADLAKIEVDAKKMKNTTVALTYKIVVTNTGNVSGKALKLVDHLPKDMEFNEKDNKGWYLGTDGKLYNESLKDENIAPGDKKEISLVLVRNMNTENTGVISNLIEIAEAESSINVVEQKANNSSTQEIILSIRTGGNFVPITIIFIIMALGSYAIMTEKMIIKIENNKLKVKINTKKIYK